jgi:hypothetical protein
MGWAHGGYTCSKCSGHIPVTVEPTGRMTGPFGVEVMDGHHLKGKLYCNECYDKEMERLKNDIRKKYPKNMSEEQKIKMIGEFLDLAMS